MHLIIVLPFLSIFNRYLHFRLTLGWPGIGRRPNI